MSVMRVSEPDTSGRLQPRPEPRVREQARDVLVLMSFSAAVSIGCSLLLLLSSGLGR
jgi:hypothetical protein